MYHLAYFNNIGNPAPALAPPLQSPTPFPAFAAGQHVLFGGKSWTVIDVTHNVVAGPGGIDCFAGVLMQQGYGVAAAAAGGGTNPVPWPW